MYIAIMIQLYNGNNIEVLQQGDVAYFKVINVFKALGLTWRSVEASLRRRGVLDLDLRRGANLAHLSSNNYKSNDPIYISEIALYQLAFRSNKPEAQEFARWCAEVIATVRKTGKYEIDSSKTQFKKHLDESTQKENSKLINAKNYANGVDTVIEYNRKNLRLHTGKSSSELKKIGKANGLKSRDLCSGKQVVRKLVPEKGAAMSFTDDLVMNENVEHEKAAQISLEFAQPLFKALINAGVDQDSINKIAGENG